MQRTLDLAFCVGGVVGIKRYRERDASIPRMWPVDVVASGTCIVHGCRRASVTDRPVGKAVDSTAGDMVQ